MSEQELKPCPFCGHAGLSFEDGSTYRWGLASCAACGATAGEVRRNYPPDEDWHKDAIAQWNTRAALAQQASRAAAVAHAAIPDVDELAQQIRWLNGSNKRGAGTLAEALVEWLRDRAAAQSKPPVQHKEGA